MKINSQRSFESLKDVLKDPNCTGPELSYIVFSNISKDKWENMTVITEGIYGDEFPKTYGHYHTASNEKEIYKYIAGKGLFILQKRALDNLGNPINNKVIEVIAVKTETIGEEIKIPTEYGHSWSNIGETPLITYDNWIWGHKDTDYSPIKELKGMAYYVIKNTTNGNVEFIKNNNYIDTPEIKIMSVKEFNNLDKIQSII